MKKIIYWTAFLLIAKSSPGQNGCFNNLNTRTTDPTEYFASDGLNPNAQKITGQSGLVDNPRHFNWIDPTATHYWYWSTSTNDAPAVIYLPYYCDGQGVSNINGACTNQNIYYYQQLINNFPTGISTHDKNKMFDILPEDGWELMFKNFGTPGTGVNVATHQPTFILYNRFTGKMKVFAAATGLHQGLSQLTNVNRAALRVSFPNNDKTALLGMAKPITQVMMSYSVSPSQGSAGHYMNNEFITPNAISHLGSAGTNAPPDYQWLMSEFIVPYDPCTCFSTNIPTIKVSILFWSNSQIDMGGLISGKLNATPADFYNGNNLDQNNKGASVATNGNIANSVEGALKTYETWSGYAEKVKKFLESKSGGSGGMNTSNIQINTIVNNWSMQTGNGIGQTQQQKNTLYYNLVLGGSTGNADGGVKEGVGFKEVLNNIASVSPYVAAFISFVDLFAGGGQENVATDPTHVIIDNPSPPVDYNVDLKVKLTGQISTQTEPTPIFPFVPGSRTSYNTPGPAPMYNNILGVFNLMAQPSFERTPLQVTFTSPTWVNTNYPYTDQCNANTITLDPGFNQLGTSVQHYKINQNVKYLLNPNAMLDVMGIDAAIVLEYDNTEDFTIANASNLGSQQLIPFYSQVGQSAPTLQNRIDFITAQSGLMLESISDDFPAETTSIIRFRTAYVPLECLNSLNFLMYGNSSVAGMPKTYLKLVCKFKKQNNTDSDPVIHIQTFDITDAVRNPSNQSQINGAGTVSFSSPPAFTEVCNHRAIQGAPPCLIWFDSNGSHDCYQSFNVNFPDPVINSISLTQFAYQNPFVANDNIAQSNINMSTSNMVISGDVSIGTTKIANGDVSFQTPNTSHIIGTSANPGPNGTVAKIFAKNDVTFNGTFTFTNSTEVRAGHQITIPSPDEVVIAGEADLMIDPNGSIVSLLLGCSSPGQVTSLAASTSDANNMCNGGVLRSAPPSDTTSSGGTATAASLPETKPIMELQRVIQEFNVMPNPTDGHVRVLLTNAGEYPASVSVENILGNKVYEIASPNSYEIDFNLSELAKGVYIVRVDSKAGGTVTKRIIKN
jgi:hypothetical protein